MTKNKLYKKLENFVLSPWYGVGLVFATTVTLAVAGYAFYQQMGDIEKNRTAITEQVNDLGSEVEGYELLK